MKNQYILIYLILFLCCVVSIKGIAQTNFNMGYSVQKEYENGGFINDSLFLVAEKIYLDCLIEDSTEYVVHYNLGTLYYNKAAHIDGIVYDNKSKLSKREIRNYDRQIDILIDKARPHFVIYGSFYKEWKAGHKDLMGIWKDDK